MEVKPEKIKFKMSQHDNGTDLRRSPLLMKASALVALTTNGYFQLLLM